MSMNLITVLYLVASICFIQALKGLSHPTTSRRGNLFGMLGMGLAVLTTVGLIYKLGASKLCHRRHRLCALSACWSAARSARSWPNASK